MATDRFILECSCPKCGGSLEVVNSANPSRYESKAIVRCSHCTPSEGQFLVTVGLVSMAEQKDRTHRPSCGTVQGARWHDRNHSQKCEACKEADARYRNPEQRQLGNRRPNKEDLVGSGRGES